LLRERNVSAGDGVKVSLAEVLGVHDVLTS